MLKEDIPGSRQSSEFRDNERKKHLRKIIHNGVRKQLLEELVKLGQSIQHTPQNRHYGKINDIAY